MSFGGVSISVSDIQEIFWNGQEIILSVVSKKDLQVREDSSKVLDFIWYQVGKLRKGSLVFSHSDENNTLKKLFQTLVPSKLF